MTSLYCLLITLKAKTFGPEPQTSIQAAHILLSTLSLCCHSQSFIYYLHSLRRELLYHSQSFKASNHLNFFAFSTPDSRLMNAASKQTDEIIFKPLVLMARHHQRSLLQVKDTFCQFVLNSKLQSF